MSTFLLSPKVKEFLRRVFKGSDEQVNAGSNPSKADSPIIEPPTNFEEFSFRSTTKNLIPLLKSIKRIFSPFKL